MPHRREGAPWRPTSQQKAVIEAAGECGLKRTISAVCEEGGVSRFTFYHWLKHDPDFAAVWDKVWYGQVRVHLPGVVAAQIVKAYEGDTAAARLVVDLSGVIKQKLEHSGIDGGPIQVEAISNLEAARRLAFMLNSAAVETESKDEDDAG